MGAHNGCAICASELKLDSSKHESELAAEEVHARTATRIHLPEEHTPAQAAGILSCPRQ